MSRRTSLNLHAAPKFKAPSSQKQQSRGVSAGWNRTTTSSSRPASDHQTTFNQPGAPRSSPSLHRGGPAVPASGRYTDSSGIRTNFKSAYLPLSQSSQTQSFSQKRYLDRDSQETMDPLDFSQSQQQEYPRRSIIGSAAGQGYPGRNIVSNGFARSTANPAAPGRATGSSSSSFPTLQLQQQGAAPARKAMDERALNFAQMETQDPDPQPEKRRRVEPVFDAEPSSPVLCAVPIARQNSTASSSAAMGGTLNLSQPTLSHPLTPATAKDSQNTDILTRANAKELNDKMAAVHDAVQEIATHIIKTSAPSLDASSSQRSTMEQDLGDVRSLLQSLMEQMSAVSQRVLQLQSSTDKSHKDKQAAQHFDIQAAMARLTQEFSVVSRDVSEMKMQMASAPLSQSVGTAANNMNMNMNTHVAQHALMPRSLPLLPDLNNVSNASTAPAPADISYNSISVALPSSTMMRPPPPPPARPPPQPPQPRQQQPMVSPSQSAHQGLAAVHAYEHDYNVSQSDNSLDMDELFGDDFTGDVDQQVEHKAELEEQVATAAAAVDAVQVAQNKKPASSSHHHQQVAQGALRGKTATDDVHLNLDTVSQVPIQNVVAFLEQRGSPTRGRESALRARASIHLHAQGRCTQQDTVEAPPREPNTLPQVAFNITPNERLCVACGTAVPVSQERGIELCNISVASGRCRPDECHRVLCNDCILSSDIRQPPQNYKVFNDSICQMHLKCGICTKAITAASFNDMDVSWCRECMVFWHPECVSDATKLRNKKHIKCPCGGRVM